MTKWKNFRIFKISIDKLVNDRNGKLGLSAYKVGEELAATNGEMVMITQSQLTNQIRIAEGMTEEEWNTDSLLDKVINITVPNSEGRSKKYEKMYEFAASHKDGVTVKIDGKNRKFVRMCGGTGSVRRNTITFIRKDLYKPVFNALMNGLTLKDFDGFSGSKFNAYLGLSTTGTHFLPEELSPRIAVVSDYEQIKPHIPVAYMTERDTHYIPLPDGEFFLTEDQNEFDIDVENKIAVRLSDGKQFNLFTGKNRTIEERYYDEVGEALNSFDGQGLCSPQWLDKVAKYLDINYTISSAIVRSPWIKGLLINFPFVEWAQDNNITEFVDAWGNKFNPAEVDVIVSQSQFKTWKIYDKKCKGENIVEYWEESRRANQNVWGLSKILGKRVKRTHTLNYQFVQQAELNDDDIKELCAETKEFLEQITSDDYEFVYEKLLSYKTKEERTQLYETALAANPDFINDRYIQQCIIGEYQTKLKNAKKSKILCSGGCQELIVDPIAQCEHIAGLEVKGAIPLGEVYSNPWIDRADQVVCLRNPFIVGQEAVKSTVMQEYNKYFRNIKSGMIFSIWSIDLHAMQGADTDGDIAYVSDSPLLLKAFPDRETVRPLIFDISNPPITGKIDKETMIQFDILGFNNQVGTISNKATILSAMLCDYPKDSKEYKRIQDEILMVSADCGQEIDRTKTGIPVTKALHFEKIYPKKDADGTVISNEEELAGIKYHNQFVPDGKPYFLRYKYDSLDSQIKSYTAVHKELCWDDFNLSLNDLMQIDDKSDEMKKFITNYWRKYPALYNNSICNHIAVYFEDVEKDITHKAKARGENMLLNYANPDLPIDDNIKSEVQKIVLTFKNSIRRRKANRVEIDDEEAGSRNALLRNYYYNLLEELIGDPVAILTYLVAVAPDEQMVWKLMGNKIVELIK